MDHHLLVTNQSQENMLGLWLPLQLISSEARGQNSQTREVLWNRFCRTELPICQAMSWAKLSFRRIRGVKDVFNTDYFYPPGLKVRQKERNN